VRALCYTIISDASGAGGYRIGESGGGGWKKRIHRSGVEERNLWVEVAENRHVPQLMLPNEPYTG
jgi:hypothetical protein